jgi:hypothetical protein
MTPLGKQTENRMSTVNKSRGYKPVGLDKFWGLLLLPLSHINGDMVNINYLR